MLLSMPAIAPSIHATAFGHHYRIYRTNSEAAVHISSRTNSIPGMNEPGRPVPRGRAGGTGCCAALRSRPGRCGRCPGTALNCRPRLSGSTWWRRRRRRSASLEQALGIEHPDADGGRRPPGLRPAGRARRRALHERAGAGRPGHARHGDAAGDLRAHRRSADHRALRQRRRRWTRSSPATTAARRVLGGAGDLFAALLETIVDRIAERLEQDRRRLGAPEPRHLPPSGRPGAPGRPAAAARPADPTGWKR